MEDFEAIPVFVTVVESNSFSSAARKLGVSKSAVSKRITQLENRLGVRLLHRTTRRMSLTEAGKSYYGLAVKALAFAKEAEDMVTQQQSKPQGRLRIHAPMAFGRLHIAPLIPKFLEHYSGIHIDLIMEDRVVDLVAGGFDVAIRTGDLPDSSMIARQLAPLHSVLCASPEYVVRKGKPNSPAQLIEHNCLLRSNSVKEWTFLGPGEPEVVQVSGNYQVNNSEALHEAVLQGAGISRLPTFIAGPDLSTGRLTHLLSSYQMPSKTLYSIFPERQHLPAKVRVFLDFAVEHFGRNKPYWDWEIF